MKSRLWCVAMAVLCSNAPLGAQTVLSEADALARLSSESPRVRAIRSAIDVAQAEVLAGSRWPNPRLTIDRESVAGITETMFMVAQPLPVSGRRGLEKSAAAALVNAATSRADDEMRRARADLRLAFTELAAAQRRERDLARARDRLQGLADVLGSGRRPAKAPGSTGFDPNAKCWTSRPIARPRRVNAPALRPRSRRFLPVRSIRRRWSPRTALPSHATDIPPVEALLARAELYARRASLALRHEIDSARFAERAADRRAIPEPEVVAGTKSSNALGGDMGSVFSVQATLPLFDHGQPEQALAVARARRAEAQLEALRVSMRAEIAALRTAVVERRGAAERYRAAAVSSAELERIAEVSYDAGERGILELLDAYRSASVAQGRQTTLDVAARQAEIELGVCQRMGDSLMSAMKITSALVTAGCLFLACNRESAAPAAEAPTLDVTSWTGTDRAVHGVSAARRRRDGALRGAPDAPRRLQRAERRAAEHRDDAGGGRRRPSRCPVRSLCGPARSASKGRCPRQGGIGGC